MKKISESELHSEFALKADSKTATITFFLGLGGVLCCLSIILCFQYVMDGIEKMMAEFKAREAAGPLEQMKLEDAIQAKLKWLTSFCFPLFILANLFWVAGGYTWSFDLGRSPKNKSIWRTGGMFVGITALVCIVIWYWLLTRRPPA